jgi:hypothetical protein
MKLLLSIGNTMYIVTPKGELPLRALISLATAPSNGNSA